MNLLAQRLTDLDIQCETNTHLFLCHLIDINMLDNTTSTNNNGYQISRHVNDGVKKQDISICSSLIID